MNLKFFGLHLFYLLVLWLPFLAIPVIMSVMMLSYFCCQRVRKHPQPVGIRFKRTAKYLLYAMILLTPFMLRHLHKHYLRHKWHAEKRVSAMFTELKNSNYQSALKYFDPNGKINNIDLFKGILRNGGILTIDNFEIIHTEVNDFDNEEKPKIIVYTQVNHAKEIVPLMAGYNEMMSYPAHNLLE